MTRRGFFALLLSLVSWASTRLRAHENAQIGQDKSEQTGESGLFEVVCLDGFGEVVWRGRRPLGRVISVWTRYPHAREFILECRGWYQHNSTERIPHGVRTRFSWEPDVWVYREHVPAGRGCWWCSCVCHEHDEPDRDTWGTWCGRCQRGEHTRPIDGPIIRVGGQP